MIEFAKCNCKVEKGKFSINDIPLDCPAVWKLISGGHTVGVFQLETNLGQDWAQKVRPNNVEELAALISLIRPGPLNAGMSQHYVDIKFGRKQSSYLHPSLKPILESTYGVMCLHEDTLVMMADGRILPIKNVKQYDKIHSYDYNTKKIVSQECHGCGPTKKCDGIKIELEDGSIIVLTGDHKILTYHGMKKAEDLEIDKDLVGVAFKTDHFERNPEIGDYIGNNVSVAYLIGYLLGDGCLTRRNVVCCGNKENICDTLMQFIELEFPKIKCTKYWHTRSWYLSLKCSQRTFSRKNDLTVLLDKLGLRTINTNKKIPDDIFVSSKDVIASCLAGLIESDGCIKTNSKGASFIYFSSKSLQLRNGFRRLCQLLGIITQQLHKEPRIQIYDTKLFEKYVGKYLKFKTIIGKRNTGETIGWHPKDILQNGINRCKSIRQFCSLTGISSSTIHNNKRSNSWLINNFTAIKAGINCGDIRFRRIKSISKVYDQQFFGISIDNLHNLIANNIVVSNCYQEQALRIATDIAGFDPIEADILRSAIGKKLPEKMAKLKNKFVEGCQTHSQIGKEIAEEIFGWIEKCQKYSFNLSHAISYGMIAYQTSWLKCHFPDEFFTSYLTFSQYKSDPKEEIYKLVQDARLFGVNILSPDIRRQNVHFRMVETPQKGVAFGLSHIRGVGASAIQKIVSTASETSGIDSLGTWVKFLSSVPQFHRNVGIALIKSGACDSYGMNRSEMVRELEVVLGTTILDSTGKKVEVKGLTNKEKIYFFEQLEQDCLTTREILLQMAQPPGDKTKTIGQMLKKELVPAAIDYLDQADSAFDGIIDGDSKFVYTSVDEKKSWLQSIGSRKKKDIEKLMIDNGYKDIIVKPPCSSDARRQIVAKKAEMLEHPINDTNTAIAAAEKHFLGIALSCSPADDADDSLATHTCLEAAIAPNKEGIVVCVIIDSVKHTKTKRGKNPGQSMCFLTISDSTYSIDHAVVFPDSFGRLKSFCKDGIVCLIYGEKRNGSFIISDIQKLM